MAGEPAVETPTATAPPAPAAQPPAPAVPAPSAPPAVQPTAGGDDITVPRSSVPGGDWHNLISRYNNMEPYGAALDAAKAAGLDPATLAYMVQVYGGAPQDPQVQQPYQPAPSPPPPPAQPGATEDLTGIVNQAVERAVGQALTGDAFRSAIGSTFDSRQQEWDRTKQTEWQQATAVRDAQEAEDKFRTAMIEGMGFKLKNEDESPNFLGQAVRRHFDSVLNNALRENEPPELRTAYDQEVAQGVNEGPALKALTHYYNTPTEDALKKAGEGLDEWKHLTWTIQAQTAAQQTAIPATAGAGPSAGPPPPPPSEMTDADHEAAAGTYQPGQAVRDEEDAGWPGEH